MPQSNFGPARDLPPDFTKMKRVVIPPDGDIIFRFSFNAWFENAVIIYRADSFDLMAERGNYDRSQEAWKADVSPDELAYLISGWHKPSPPDADIEWRQSRMRVFIEKPQTVVVGFDDGGGDDFDDALCTVAFT